jgi:hypothetical protein
MSNKIEKIKISKKKLDNLKWKIKTNYESIIFCLLNILFVLIIVCSISVSVQYANNGELNKYNVKSIDIFCQTVTAIVSFVASTIGIAITLQKEDCWGVSEKDFGNLRVGLRYPIPVFITLAILFVVLNACFYLVELYIASFGVAIVAVLFCIYVVWLEVPLMLKDEKFLLKTVKNRMYKEYNSKQDLPKELKCVLKFMLVDSKNLIDTYKVLKTKNKSYNEFLILTLLELQTDIAFDLKIIESKEVQLKYADSLLNNVDSLIAYDIDLLDILGEKSIHYAYLLTRVLFGLKEIPEYEEKTTFLVANSLFDLKYSKYTDDKIKFNMSIILSMVAVSIRNNDFSFVKAIQEKYSIYHYDLGQDNYSTIVFALVSMQFYFLCNDSKNASTKLKNGIRKYLKSTWSSHHTKVNSWCNLYNYFLSNFNLNFSEFMCYFSYSEKDWDVPVYFEAEWVILDKEYALKWYLVQLLNSENFHHVDFASMCLDEHFEFYFKKFANECFDYDNKFVITDEMKKMVEFYDSQQKPLDYFKMVEDNEHKLSGFIKALKEKDLDNEIIAAEKNDNHEIANKYETVIKQEVQSAWGYNPELEIISENKTMAILIEKASRAINYEEVMLKTLKKSIFNELSLHTPRKIIERNADFKENIERILKERYAYSSNSMQRVVRFIEEESNKKLFEDICNQTTKFTSQILNGNVFVKQDGFAFNFVFTEFSVSNLSADEVNNEVESYKRADGQYVYDGTFLSREQIERYISKKYAVLKISMKYNIQTYADSIIEIKLF